MRSQADTILETELARVSRVVGKEGELSQRAVMGGWTQSWSGSLESVNSMIDALVRPTSEMQRVIGAVADGDLSKKVSAEVGGDMLELMAFTRDSTLTFTNAVASSQYAADLASRGAPAARALGA